MKFRMTQQGLQTFVKICLFVCAIALIAQLFPRQGSFKYNFQVGKPWYYNLITASFDFPVYKTDSEIKAEQDSLLRNFTPYYRINTVVYHQNMQKLNARIQSDSSLLTADKAYVAYLLAQLNELYEKGIVGTAEYNRILEAKYPAVLVVKDQLAKRVEVKDLFAEKSAYEYILKNKPERLDEGVLRSLNINLYLSENLFYDKSFSEQAKLDLLKNMSLTSGMVQTGERIIDRGEIVTERTYRLLNSLKIATENLKGGFQNYYLILIGQVLLIVSLLSLFFLYLYLFRSKIFNSNKYVIFMLMMIVLMIALASSVIKYTTLSIYIVPFALLPIIIRTFFDSRTALFAHIITILQISLMVAEPYEFIFLQLTVGMTTVSSLKDLTQRSQLVQTAIFIFITYTAMFLGSEFVMEGDLKKVDWIIFLYFGISSLLLLFAYGLIYIFEKAFGFLSNVTLIELSNINTSLLLKFSELAPGSFQHSLQVANLVTEAGRKINANTLLLRTGALYHDIGKMENPSYFTENRPGGGDLLAEMPMEEATEKILNHVTDGVELAKKHNLPEMIIDFIRTHHGTGRMKYFYNTYKNKFPDAKLDDNMFRYKGPLPFTKETALLMMADAVEASSRSLKEHTEESINNLVENIINGQIAEGMFKESPINFRDVETVKAVFKDKLKTIYHARVSYPELKTAVTPN
jgi:putative nucleotidyltransferase with HDIG domain